jgi:Peptidase family M1 domain
VVLPLVKTCLAVAAAVALAIACGGDDDSTDETSVAGTDDLSEFDNVFNQALALDDEDLRGAPVYDIQATLSPDDLSLAGRETVALVNSREDEIEQLVFRVYANAEFNGGDNVEISELMVDGRPVDYNLQESLLTAELTEPLGSGDETVVEIAFEQNIPELGEPSPLDLGGDEAGYGVYGASQGLIALGYWYPALLPPGTDAAALPSGGDVSNFDAAYYRVRFTAPSDWELAASGEEVDAVDVEDGTHHEFVAAGARDFAIVLAEDFERLEEERDGVTYRVHYRTSEVDFRQAGHLLDFASDAVAVYSERFGPYLYDELDVAPIALRGGAAGIEFSGLVGIGTAFYGGDPLGAFGGLFGQDGGEDSNSDAPDILEDLLESDAIEDLFGETIDSLFGGESGGIGGLEDVTEFVVAHEVAHQWWYNAVGSDSVGHPWMDESLTNYSAVVYFEDRHGVEEAEAQVQAQLVLPFQTMGILGGEDAVVDQPADAFSSAVEYSGVVYGKGGYFFLELRELVGDEAFLSGLREYYETYILESAPNAAMVDIIAERSEDPEAVRALYERWIQEVHGEEDIGEISGLEGLIGGEGSLGGVLEDLLDGLVD